MNVLLSVCFPFVLDHSMPIVYARLPFLNAACTNSCPSGQYQHKNCTADADSACTACTTADCPVGYYESQPCSQYSDRVCSPICPAISGAGGGCPEVSIQSRVCVLNHIKFRQQMLPIFLYCSLFLHGCRVSLARVVCSSAGVVGLGPMLHKSARRSMRRRRPGLARLFHALVW
jgi:hypothetical protein